MPQRYLQIVRSPGLYESDSFTLNGAHVIDTSAEDFSADRSKIYPQPSSRRSVRAPVLGPNKITGSFNIPVYTLGVPTLFHYALGNTATVANRSDGNSYAHTMTPAIVIPSFIFAAGRDEREHRYVGATVNSFTIDITPDETVNCSFDIVARKELHPAAISVPTYPDFDLADRAIGGTEMAAFLGNAETNVVTTTLIESFSVSLENNFQADAFSIGSEFLRKNIVAEHSVTGSFDLRFDDITQYNEFMTDTQKKVKFTGNRNSGSSAERELDIEIPRMSYDTNNLPTENVQRYMEKLEWTALDSLTAQNNIIVKFINQESNSTLTA